MEPLRASEKSRLYKCSAKTFPWLFSLPSEKKCLVVRHDLRYTVDNALSDPFFNISLSMNAKLKRDLKDLESKVGQKWLTSYEQLSCDEERWMNDDHIGMERDKIYF